MQNKNNNPSKQIIFSNGSIITPIETGEIIRGRRRGMIEDIKDISDYISKEELDEIIGKMSIKMKMIKSDSKGGRQNG